jgi:hypothetical protein
VGLVNHVTVYFGSIWYTQKRARKIFFFKSSVPLYDYLALKSNSFYCLKKKKGKKQPMLLLNYIKLLIYKTSYFEVSIEDIMVLQLGPCCTNL